MTNLEKYMVNHIVATNKATLKEEFLNRIPDNATEILTVAGSQTINLIAGMNGKKGALAHYYMTSAIRFMYHVMSMNQINPDKMLDYCCNSIINKDMLLAIINNIQAKTNLTVCLDEDMSKFVKIYSDDLELALVSSDNIFGIDKYNSEWIRKILASLDVITENFIKDEDTLAVAKLLREALFTLLNYNMFQEFGTVKMERSKWESYLDLALVYSGAFCLGFITTYLLTAMCCSALDGMMGGSIYAPSAGIQVAVNV